MVKIVGICGSPRKAATYYALEKALGAAAREGDVETELISLRGKTVTPCIACNKCVRDVSPVCTLHKDDVTDLLPRVLEADGLILASPVYSMAPTPQMMAFLSRFRGTWVVLNKNPDAFAHIAGGAITVGGTRNGGQESVIKTLMGWFHTQGLTPVNGGLCMYEGACVWSQDKGAEGAAADEQGILRCERIGQKVARMAKVLKGSAEFDEPPIKVFEMTAK